MGDPLATGAAALALLWTVFQQYQINKMCAACVWRQGTAKPSTEKEVRV